MQCQQFDSGPLKDKVDEYGRPACQTQCPFEVTNICIFSYLLSIANSCKYSFLQVIAVEKAEDYLVNDERLCTFIDDDECRATFVYGYHNETGTLLVYAQKTKECPVVVDIMGKYCTVPA